MRQTVLFIRIRIRFKLLLSVLILSFLCVNVVKYLSKVVQGTPHQGETSGGKGTMEVKEPWDEQHSQHQRDEIIARVPAERN